MEPAPPVTILGVEYPALADGKYDAVILDINMPRMNGLEVLSHLQKESIKTPVVVVSTLTI